MSRLSTDGRNVKIGLEFWNRIRNCLTFVRGLQNVKYKILAATISSHNLNSLLPSSSNAKCPNGNLRCNPVWLELQCFYWRLWHFPQKILKLLWHEKKCCHVMCDKCDNQVLCYKNPSILINRLGMAMRHFFRCASMHICILAHICGNICCCRIFQHPHGQWSSLILISNDKKLSPATSKMIVHGTIVRSDVCNS